MADIEYFCAAHSAFAYLGSAALMRIAHAMSIKNHTAHDAGDSMLR